MNTQDKPCCYGSCLEARHPGKCYCHPHLLLKKKESYQRRHPRKQKTEVVVADLPCSYKKCYEARHEDTLYCFFHARLKARESEAEENKECPKQPKKNKAEYPPFSMSEVYSFFGRDARKEKAPPVPKKEEKEDPHLMDYDLIEDIVTLW